MSSNKLLTRAPTVASLLWAWKGGLRHECGSSVWKHSTSNSSRAQSFQTGTQCLDGGLHWGFVGKGHSVSAWKGIAVLTSRSSHRPMVRGVSIAQFSPYSGFSQIMNRYKALRTVSCSRDVSRKRMIISFFCPTCLMTQGRSGSGMPGTIAPTPAIFAISSQSGIQTVTRPAPVHATTSGSFSQEPYQRRYLNNSLLVHTKPIGHYSVAGKRSCTYKSSGSESRGNWWDENLLWCIMGVNVVVFVVWQNVSMRRFMAKHFALSTYGVLYERRYHTVITAMFSHYDHLHLLTNMITLWVFGAETLTLLGARQFLGLYMLGGTISSFCQVYWPIIARTMKLSPALRDGFSPYQLGLGASGALNAIVAYSIMSFPQRTILLYFILPVPAAVLGLVFLGKDIAGLAYGDGSMGNAAHVGGTLYGISYFGMMSLKRFMWKRF